MTLLTLYPVVPTPPPVCTVLTDELAHRLGALNTLNRDLREIGIQVVAQNLAASTLTIGPDDVRLMLQHFSFRIRSLLSRTEGALTRHRAEFGAVSVVWFTPVQEQDA